MTKDLPSFDCLDLGGDYVSENNWKAVRERNGQGGWITVQRPWKAGDRCRLLSGAFKYRLDVSGITGTVLSFDEKYLEVELDDMCRNVGYFLYSKVEPVDE